MNDEIERSRDGKKPEACLIMDFPILLNVFTLDKLKIQSTHYSKSWIFVQKINFDKTPIFSRVFHPIFLDNFSREIKVVNS